MKSAGLLKSLVRNRFYLFIFAMCISLAVASVLRAQSGIVYVYDELGRLIAVTDPGGDTVRYTYDAAGNVTAISRASSATLSLIGFSPTSGPVGTTVIIYGTAFSTTPANNTVTFNGTGATVSASTATQITTTVPSGATTGVIQVTTSAGSVSSSTNFTVAASTAPTISGISPTIGVAGTSVTVTGTNFDTTAAKNKTRFNLTNTPATSATSTSISTTVPPVTTSGKVSVTTAKGTAVSADDFFVAPSPYTASDVADTGRMTPGSSETVTLSTSGKIGLIVFEGEAGKRASVKTTSCSITSTKIAILQPNGVQLSYGNSNVGGGFMSTPVLPVTGTYTILVDPDATYTGSVTFTLYHFNDITNTITAGGSAVTVTTTTPGQNALVTFTGTANQRISLKLSSGSWSGGAINGTHVDIVSTTNTTLSSLLLTSSGFIDTQTLAASGTHTILVDPTDACTGSLTLTLYDVAADTTGSITPGGSAITVTSTTPGQNNILTFSGTANQRISLKMSSGSWTNGNFNGVQVYIKKPDTTNLANLLLVNSGFIDLQILPTTGTYTILTDPNNSTYGSITLTLYEVAADTTGSITPDGSAVSVSNTSQGQNNILTFSGTTDQKVSVKVTSSSYTGGGNAARVSIKKADGTSLGNILVSGSTGFLDTITLPSTETYTLLTDPFDSSIGGLTNTLYDIVDTTGSITINGSAVTITTSEPGTNHTLTFSGTASQVIRIQVASNNTTSCVNVVLKQPSGATMLSTSFCGATFTSSSQTLPATGTYTITFNPSSSGTGSFDVTVTNP